MSTAWALAKIPGTGALIRRRLARMIADVAERLAREADLRARVSLVQA